MGEGGEMRKTKWVEKDPLSPRWEDWLSQALKPLENHPDRDWVEQELLDHLEDRVADFQRIFPSISREEAEREALARLGNPGPVGEGLARSHSRFWGNFYWFTYALVRLGVVVLAATLPFWLWQVASIFFYLCQISLL